MKRAALAAGLWLATSAAAWPADSAELNILGFSPDSHYFAFEQFGIQDGSGFAFDDIFVIDLTKDEWAKGSPIKVQAKDEDKKLSAIVEEAHGKYAPFQKSLNITEPAQILARNAVTEVIANRKTITFDTWYSSSEGGATPDVTSSLKEARYTLSLTEQNLSAPKACPADMGDFAGFTLSLHAEKDNSNRVLFQDSKIPETRNCPYSYDLQAVVTNLTDTKSDYLVAIIGVYALGFEGKDLRYLAVPFKLQP